MNRNALRMSIALSMFLVSLCSTFAQNSSYNIFYDSLYPIAKHNFDEAKKIYTNTELQNRIDPTENFLFIIEALKNKDIDFYKAKMSLLIEKNGFLFTENMHSVSYNHNFVELLEENKLLCWTRKRADSLYPLWVRNNRERLIISNRINELFGIDQAYRTSGFIDDSLCYNNYGPKQDLDNLYQVLELSDSSGLLPNNFDHSYGTYNKWFVILLHNLKTPRIKDVWRIVEPYIEYTYLKGKISDECFYVYDYLMNNRFGCQVYGQLEDVKSCDASDSLEKIKKLGLY